MGRDRRDVKRLAIDPKWLVWKQSNCLSQDPARARFQNQKGHSPIAPRPERAGGGEAAGARRPPPPSCPPGCRSAFNTS